MLRPLKTLRIIPIGLLAASAASLGFTGCGSDAPPMAHAVRGRDSLPVMYTRGVTKLISDSGVMRYKIVAEEWAVYDKTTPPRWEFNQGLFLERFDDKFKANMHVTADSAVLYDQKLWKLRGHIVLKDDAAHVVLHTNELYWNMNSGELSSNVYTRLTKPDEEIEGNWFRATVVNRQLTSYHVRQTKGFMPMGNYGSSTTTTTETTDTIVRDSTARREAPASRPKQQ